MRGREKKKTLSLWKYVPSIGSPTTQVQSPWVNGSLQNGCQDPRMMVKKGELLYIRWGEPVVLSLIGTKKDGKRDRKRRIVQQNEAGVEGEVKFSSQGRSGTFSEQGCLNGKLHECNIGLIHLCFTSFLQLGVLKTQMPCMNRAFPRIREGAKCCIWGYHAVYQRHKARKTGAQEAEAIAWW